MLYEVYIYFLCLINFFTIFLFNILTLNRITLVNFLSFFAFFYSVLRPIAIVVNKGSYLYHGKWFDWDLYVFSLVYYTLYQFVFFFIFYFLNRRSDFKIQQHTEFSSNLCRIDLFAFLFLVLSLAYLYVKYGLSILPSFRTSSLTTFDPSLRYVYPFIMVFSAALSARSTIGIITGSLVTRNVIYLIISLVSIVTIGQRGLALMFVFIGISSLWNSGYRFKVLAAGFGLVFLAFFGRSVTNLFSGSKIGDFSAGSLLEGIGNRPDGDVVEVLVVVMKYTEEFGYKLGETLIFNLFSVLSNRTRLESDLVNGLDVMNMYYDPYGYEVLGFGFNISAVQELFLNFGFLGLIFVPIFALVFAWIYRIYNRYVRSDYSLGLVYGFLPVFGVFNLINSFSGLQWSALVLFVWLFLVALNKRFVFR